MNAEDMTTRKRVPIDRIKLGMFVVGLDKSWLETPMLFHRQLIKSEADIELLKRNGVHEVEIDTARGVDLEPVRSTPGSSAERDSRAQSGVAPTTLQAPKPSDVEVKFLLLAKELTAAQSIHAEAISATQIIFDGARGGAPVKREVAEGVVQHLTDSVFKSPEANLLLCQMRRFDRDVFSHTINVCVLALVINGSEALDLDPFTLGLGALLHDIGETRLPRNLIRRNSGFTEVELRLIEQHPELGQRLLPIEQFAEIVRTIAFEHHERIDGSGYPQRKTGEEVNLPTRLVALCDMYDDMMSGRNQAALAANEVLRQLYLQANAGALDRGLVEKTIRCLGVYPIGSLVELSSGDRAIVVAANKLDALKPTVRIITSRTGFMQKHGPVVSLADAASDGIERRIVIALDPRKERIDPMAYLSPAPVF